MAKTLYRIKEVSREEFRRLHPDEALYAGYRKIEPADLSGLEGAGEFLRGKALKEHGAACQLQHQEARAHRHAEAARLEKIADAIDALTGKGEGE